MFILLQEIYRGPTSDNSRFEALHGVTIVDAFLMNGELVFWCKSSHGPKSHDKGYILVSGEMMVMGHHFAGRGDSTFGLNRGIGGDTALALSQPKPLIHEFVYPILELETKKRKRYVMRLNGFSFLFHKSMYKYRICVVWSTRVFYSCDKSALRIRYECLVGI